MANASNRQDGRKANQQNPEPRLSRQQIAALALELIDADGLGSFSQRNLARALGVSAAALYWHVPNRNAVLAEVIALVIAGVSPSADLPWQEYLHRLISNFRAAMRRHPNAAPLLGAELVANSATDLALVEGILRALAQAGFAGERLVTAYNATCVAMVGFAMEELCPMPEDAEAWQLTVQQRLALVSPQDHPLLSAHLPLLADRGFMLRWRNGVAVPMDDSFAMFVDAFILGLAAIAPSS